MEGAKVIVDGQLRAVTDSLGHYRLDKVLYCFYLMKLYGNSSVAFEGSSHTRGTFLCTLIYSIFFVLIL